MPPAVARANRAQLRLEFLTPLVRRITQFRPSAADPARHWTRKSVLARRRHDSVQDSKDKFTFADAPIE